MRIATPALLVIVLAAPALAQLPEPVPDPTAPWLYYPLGVGDEWHYEEGGSAPVRYFRRAIERDTLVDGVRYVVEAHYVATPGATGWNPMPGLPTQLIRYDSTTTRIVRPDGSVAECALGSAFWSQIDCYEGQTGPGGEPEETLVVQVVQPAVLIGPRGRAQAVPVLSIKGFYIAPADVSYPYYAAPLGYVARSEEPFNPHYYWGTVFVRVGGVEYGEPISVDTEPRPPAQALALTAAPNPSAGPLSLSLALRAAGTVGVEAFDALGRRVHQETHTLPDGTHALPLDASAWGPGVYLVRATAGGASATARVVRR